MLFLVNNWSRDLGVLASDVLAVPLLRAKLAKSLATWRPLVAAIGLTHLVLGAGKLSRPDEDGKDLLWHEL